MGRRAFFRFRLRGCATLNVASFTGSEQNGAAPPGRPLTIGPVRTPTPSWKANV